MLIVECVLIDSAELAFQEENCPSPLSSYLLMGLGIYWLLEKLQQGNLELQDLCFWS